MIPPVYSNVGKGGRNSVCSVSVHDKENMNFLKNC